MWQIASTCLPPESSCNFQFGLRPLVQCLQEKEIELHDGVLSQAAGNVFLILIGQFPFSVKIVQSLLKTLDH